MKSRKIRKTKFDWNYTESPLKNPGTISQQKTSCMTISILSHKPSKLDGLDMLAIASVISTNS